MLAPHPSLALTEPLPAATMCGSMPTVRRVSLLGLPHPEREAITTCLLAARGGNRRYVLAEMLDEADLFIADASHAPSVQLVVATERLAATVFVGSSSPPGSVACLSRPIDTVHLLRELDFLIAAPRGLAGAHLQKVAASRWKGEERRSQAMLASPLPRDAPAPTALLVDDSEIALRFLETRLQRFGLLTERALSSGRAVELMAQRNFDFIFLDVELGPTSDLDGLALCQHIKRHQPPAQALSSAVFLVSAHNGELDRVRGTLAGCDAYLGKPLDEVALQRLLLRHGLRPRSDATHEGAQAD